MKNGIINMQGGFGEVSPHMERGGAERAPSEAKGLIHALQSSEAAPDIHPECKKLSTRKKLKCAGNVCHWSRLEYKRERRTENPD